MSQNSKCAVAYVLAKSTASAGTYAAPTLATDGVDISLPDSTTTPGSTLPPWNELPSGNAAGSGLRRGPKHAQLMLQADATCAVTNGQIWYYVARYAKWFSIGQIYNTGAASLTTTGGALVQFEYPAAADRLAFSGTLSAGNVIARFVPIWEET